MKTSIFVKTEFAGIHCWPDAPKEVTFLRNPHRHIFKIKVTIPITQDRQLEFFMVKNRIEKYLSLTHHFTKHQSDIPDLGAMSCERIATEILIFLKQRYNIEGIKVSVSEDDENGSIVEDQT
jgi:6-pyruvoyl-tetrahydropterin synthase